MRLLADECWFLQWVFTEQLYVSWYKGLEPRAWRGDSLVCVSPLASFSLPHVSLEQHFSFSAARGTTWGALKASEFCRPPFPLGFEVWSEPGC